jgi:transposase
MCALDGSDAHMDKRVTKDTRRKHSDALKLDLVRRSLQPGASVAALAQENGINANLLFNWRRLHLRALGADAPVITSPTLLPVTVQPDTPAPTTVQAGTHAAPARASTGTIEIEFGTARVRLRGAVDEASVRSVLRALSELA